MTNEIFAAIARFPSLRIAVIGDFMLDHYIEGSTERVSPEAPVPVVLERGETFVAGGAANVARNVAAAGATALCLGVVGDDEPGRRLLEQLEQSGVDTAGIFTSADFPTIVKTRIVSQGQQIVRLDHERAWSPEDSVDQQLAAAAESLVAGCDAVILSDYGKGLLTGAVIRNVIAASAAKQVPVFVDPKGRDYRRYAGAYAITPNSREAYEATGVATTTGEGLRAAALAIREMTGAQNVVITRGADGLALLNGADEWLTVPTSAREVFDVTGAGDTFVAWLTMAVAQGQSAESAARLANAAAGVAVGRVGPATASPYDIVQALSSGRLARKLISQAVLPVQSERLRREGKKIVLTNGCFDFLHAGHIAFLQEARALGDVLVLAMNTDDSIRRLKGEPRPIIGQMQRAELLASIDAVDHIVIFEEDTPHEVIRALKPDVLVKGGNYTLDQVEGAELVRASGGEVVTVPLQHDIKTSRLIGQE